MKAPSCAVEVVRAPTRDAVVVFYIDALEGEPIPGVLWLLDGPSGNVGFYEGVWDWAFAPGGDAVVLGLGASPRLPEDACADSSALARDPSLAGLSEAELEEVVFRDGFTGCPHFVRPAIVSLATGEARLLPAVGGGTLAPFEGAVVELGRPRHWALPEAPEAESAPPRVLDLSRGTFRTIDAARRDRAWEAFGHSYGIDADWNADGSVLIATRDGRLGLVRVDGSYAVQARALR